MNRNLPRVAYRPREAAEVTGLSLRFLYYAIQHKDLPTVRVGRCRLITEKALREWLERKTEATVETTWLNGLQSCIRAPHLYRTGLVSYR